MLKLLTESEREPLREIFESEFDSALPTEEQAHIIAVTEDGELQAFATAELLIHTDLFWIAPRYRKTAKAASFIKTLARYFFNRIPENSSAVIFAANDNQARLFTKLGLTEVENVRVFRLDN